MIPLLLMLRAITAPGCFMASDERKTVDVVCPVDGHRFQAMEVRSNRWGGVDADWCAHAFKTTPLELYAWVCPRCAYAGRKADFERALSDAEKKALKEGLKPLEALPPGARQDKVPGYVKFDLMAQAARLRGLPPLDVGRAYLHASWSARQRGAVYLDGFDEWDAIYRFYQLDQEPMKFGLSKNRTDFDLEVARKVAKDVEAKRWTRGPEKLLAPYLAAYLQRKHGENAEALRWLEALDALRGENSVVDEAAKRMRASIALERDFQRKAVEALEPLGTSPDHAYLLGELRRRLGEREAARACFDQALGAGPSEGLKKLILEQRAKLK
jgi:hypothetical protein